MPKLRVRYSYSQHVFLNLNYFCTIWIHRTVHNELSNCMYLRIIILIFNKIRLIIYRCVSGKIPDSLALDFGVLLLWLRMQCHLMI